HQKLPDALRALTLIAEAIALAREIGPAQSVETAQAALTDTDLSPLNLNAATAVTTDTRSIFGTVRGPFQSAVDQALAKCVTRDQASDFLRLMVQRAAVE